MKQKLTQKDIEKKYDSFSRYYDLIEGLLEFPIIGRLRKMLLKEVRGKVLDIGIGTGKNLKYYSKECEITGIDLSEGMLKVARKRAVKLKLDVKFIKGNSEKLPFKKEEFNFVVGSLGLCTYKHPVKALIEMKRVCKRNGKILLLEHGISNNPLIAFIQNKREGKHYLKAGCHLTRNPEELAKKAGVNIINAKRKILGIFYLVEAKS